MTAVDPIVWNWKSILALIFAVVGTIGNSIVIIVYARKRSSGRNGGRRTHRNATDAFILNLAFADLITSICIIPRPKLSKVNQDLGGQIYCRVVNTDVILWVSIVASIFTLTLVSIERYLAIVYPIRYRTIFAGNRARLVLVLIWLVSLVLNSFNVYCVGIDPVKESCTAAYPSLAYQQFIGAGLFVVEYFIPMVIMIVTHVLAIRALRAHARTLLSRNESPNSPAYSLLNTRRKVIEMLLTVVIIFIVCWSGDQVMFLAFNLGYAYPEYLASDIYQAFFLLAFVNSCANPIIYTFKNQQFRRAVKGLFKRQSNRVNDVTKVRGIENGLSQMSLINALFLNDIRATYPQLQKPAAHVRQAASVL
ncbi:galanin receptor 2a-like [Asterias amurensis]|uniref:galanin receptor 2a-like n=1 Tax=Asterias amurensis TaxID=7602 RepID=UPI003AB5D7B0